MPACHVVPIVCRYADSSKAEEDEDEARETPTNDKIQLCSPSHYAWNWMQAGSLP